MKSLTIPSCSIVAALRARQMRARRLAEIEARLNRLNRSSAGAIIHAALNGAIVGGLLYLAALAAMLAGIGI